MDDYEYKESLKKLEKKLKNIEDIINPNKIKSSLKEIDDLEKDEKFWTDNKKVASVQKEKIRLQNKLQKYNKSSKLLKDNIELYEIAKEEKDDETIKELIKELAKVEETIKKTEIQVMLNEETDCANAIISIHPGAGGTESQDWAYMLFRMYIRFAERNNFKTEILDYQEAEEAGIKDVSFIIKGENAYGYLKNDNGIHRLVRISPFDSNAKRHTSFSSVYVSPEIDDSIDINIEDKDLRIDTYRASGAGGQHINKTESAVRITHKPSNIIVQCQNDRSQHKNKATAMKMLRSKLYEFELAKKKENNLEKSDIAWGHQIRSYVLAPYRQVKDLRSNIAYSNVDALLDGDLNKLIEDLLVSRLKT